ncbi:phage protein Gp37 [Pseudomonas sp. D47]|uniref:phage protein Gp37 n=1 Tax=Pseudomonas sp. D47 TaxID=3159447 RepID=UPI00387AA363
MLGEIEIELINTIKNSELGKHLKVVASLPSMPDKDVLNRWGADAPAAYVVALDGSVTNGEFLSIPFVVVLVARNARGPDAARHGDKRVIGLYDMVKAGFALLHGATWSDGKWLASSYQFMQDVELRNAGLSVALISLRTSCDVPTPSTANLSEFEHLYASWAVVPPDQQDGKPLAEAFIHLNPESAQ